MQNYITKYILIYFRNILYISLSYVHPLSLYYSIFASLFRERVEFTWLHHIALNEWQEVIVVRVVVGHLVPIYIFGDRGDN